MAKLDMRETTREVCEVLRKAAAESDEDHTVWMDVDAIAIVVLGSARQGTRRTVRQILKYLIRRGSVKTRDFDGHVGYRMVR